MRRGRGAFGFLAIPPSPHDYRKRIGQSVNFGRVVSLREFVPESRPLLHFEVVSPNRAMCRGSDFVVLGFLSRPQSARRDRRRLFCCPKLISSAFLDA